MAFRKTATALATAVLATCVALAPRPTRAATPAQVDAAIEKAKAFLLKHQNAKGNWEQADKPDPKGGQAEVTGKQWGGLTSIAIYALLAADTPKQDPRIAKAVEFLKGADIEGIYAAGLRCQVWLLMNDEKKLKPFIVRDGQMLITAVYADPGKKQQDQFGFYGYWLEKNQIKPDGWYDRSVSQYGVLGMWALEQAGLEVPQKYWELVDFAWRRAQHPDGGWSYRKGADGPDKGKSSATMTAAGVATLFITQDYLLGNVAECRGNILNKNIEEGLAWMDKNINAALGGSYYGMYGIERIGVASGRKYFGTVNWYEVGADRLVKSQSAEGGWGDIPNTCFGLLFLTRGRAPVIFNKLEYSLTEKNGKTVEGPWNERPRDAANFARWMGHNLERDLNWQVVNLKVPVEDLHDAPILYISGNKDLELSKGEMDKLRLFCEQGGLILGNADCGSNIFEKSFKALGGKLFPKYEFRELPQNHVIYTDEQFKAVKWRGNKPKVLGMSNGARELMILIPEADVSRAFQGRNEKTKEELYQLGADIGLYAVDKKNLRAKGDTYLVKEDPAVKTDRATTLVRLDVGGNPDPEPAGWTRLAAVLHNADKVALAVRPAVKPDAPGALAGAKLAHLTGTTTFKLTDAQRQAIKDFIAGGGTLIIDAAGGSAEFADAAEIELKATFGNAGDILPPESIIYNLPGRKIDEVHYRNYARSRLAGDARSARVRAIKDAKGRPAVFYSREDLSAGLVGEPVDGILGYEPATATAIMRNLVLFGAFGPPKPPATKPAATQPATKPSTNPAPPTIAAPATQPAPAAPAAAAEGAPAPAAAPLPPPAPAPVAEQK